jgi:hypothetical protein
VSDVLLLASVLPGREDDVSAALASMPSGEGSPLGRVPGTHFARLVFIPGLESRRRRLRRRAGAFLLFAAEFDGDMDAYLTALARLAGPELDSVLHNCAGYPGAADRGLADWARAHKIAASYSVLAYPGATVEEIRESLELRRRLSRFAVRSAGLDPQRLQSAWRQEFGGTGG